MEGSFFKKFQPPLVETVPAVGDFHLMTPGSVIVASVGNGPQHTHTPTPTSPHIPRCSLLFRETSRDAT